MSREILSTMLQDQSGEALTQEGDTFKPAEGTQLTLLLAAHGGPAPLPRLVEISLKATYLEAHTDEAMYALPYDRVVGIKVERRGDRARSRAGFGA